MLRYGFLASLVLTMPASVQEQISVPTIASATDAKEEWPFPVPLTVLSSPDWTDYRIYPTEARRYEQEGAVAVETLIGKDGVPRDCRVLQASGYPALDRGTCQLSLKMRFAPPLDQSGKSVESVFRQRIVWALAPRPLPFLKSSMAASLTLEAGQVTSCNLSGEGPLLGLWSRLACRVFANQPEYFLGVHRDTVAGATVYVDMTPVGNGPINGQSPSGRLIASRRTEFELNRKGEAVKCRTHLNDGFGVPVREHTAPCTFFLHRAVEFRKSGSAKIRKGVLTIRVYEDE